MDEKTRESQQRGHDGSRSNAGAHGGHRTHGGHGGAQGGHGGHCGAHGTHDPHRAHGGKPVSAQAHHGPDRSAFLPVSREDMAARGWDQCDFVFVSGDAYVDHPSFACAIITRNRADFERSTIPVYDCAEFFAHLKDAHGLVYEEIDW